MDEFLKQEGGSDAEQLIRIAKIHWSHCLSHLFNTYWALTKPAFLWDLLGKRVLPQGRVFLGSLGVLRLKPVEPSPEPLIMMLMMMLVSIYWVIIICHLQ